MSPATLFQHVVTALRLAPKGATARLSWVILFQMLCAVIFLLDVFKDMATLGRTFWTDLHQFPELGAALGLGVGITLQFRFLAEMIRRDASLTRGMNLAAGALAKVMESYFQDWQLTRAEQDVAGFTIKGYAIAEIAQMRGSAEGTVKTHLNAIYRKAGVTGRAQLVSLLVEDLLRAPLLEEGPQV